MPATAIRFTRALARRPADTAVDGLRAVDRGAPDVQALRAEHAAYVAALEMAGVAVEVLPPLEAYPDSLFVEDPRSSSRKARSCSGRAHRPASAKRARSPRRWSPASP